MAFMDISREKIREINTHTMNIKIRVPDGKSGDWEVNSFTIKQSERVMLYLHYGNRAPMPGNYKRLLYKDEVIMSNTWAEVADHLPFIERAAGIVLINGLGLGMCIEGILEKKSVKSIIVVEKSKDVIKLVAPTYKTDNRIEIVNADAFTYKPPKGIRFNAVWHDIWPNICSDNLDEMSELHRKYAKITNWQGSWAKAECQRQRRRSFSY